MPLPTATRAAPSAPQALTPLDGARAERGQRCLQWLSVGTLNASEVYVVKIVPEGRIRDKLTATTTGTSYRIPSDWLARQDQRTTRFSWIYKSHAWCVPRPVARDRSGYQFTQPLSHLPLASTGQLTFLTGSHPFYCPKLSKPRRTIQLWGG